ncbi:MAG: hypothetical protein L0332_17715 [Chloroflexi bacterium]|nr:hypothetical protein [Chloroflexota bacterium]MCI0728539.1 hypothetical protein [Chloroflexota bacterium]
MSTRLSTVNGRGAAVGIVLIAALIGFEIFNFDTTKYALRNLFGELRFAGLEWAAILAFAFCGIDLAGLVRMFTPQRGAAEPKEVWLLGGAWLMGATMNAMMTWYAVSLVIASRPVGIGTVSQADMVFYAPIFVALLVWLTRILFIGALSIAADRLSPSSSRTRSASRRTHYRNSGRAHDERPVESYQDDFFLG